jgi:hypothetical protein
MAAIACARPGFAIKASHGGRKRRSIMPDRARRALILKRRLQALRPPQKPHFDQTNKVKNQKTTKP